MGRQPGYKWRTLAWGYDGKPVEQRFVPSQSVKFDELVIDDWFHLEEMNSRHYWMRICNRHINVVIPSKGKPYIASEWDDE